MFESNFHESRRTFRCFSSWEANSVHLGGGGHSVMVVISELYKDRANSQYVLGVPLAPSGVGLKTVNCD